MQELEDARADAQDLLGTTAARYFTSFRAKINQFLNLLYLYKQEFQSHIGPLLVQIRGAGKEESELANYLQDHFSGPFSEFNVETWIER